MTLVGDFECSERDLLSPDYEPRSFSLSFFLPGQTTRNLGHMKIVEGGLARGTHSSFI